MVRDPKWLNRFDTWESYIEATKRPTDTWDSIHRHRSSISDDSYSREWTESTVKEWESLQAYGWDTPSPQVRELTDAITEELRPRMIDTFNQRIGVKGHKVMMGRYIAGSPTCMANVEPMKISEVGGVVTILVSGFFSWRVDTAEIIRRGVSICALVECLDLMQHSSEIWIEITVESISRGTDLHTTLVRLKGAEEQLDIPRLLYAIAHPSAFRRTWFAFAETLPADEVRHIGSNYGYQSDEITQAENVEATITLPILKYPFPDAMAWVRTNLQKFGLLEGDE